MRKADDQNRDLGELMGSQLSDDSGRAGAGPYGAAGPSPAVTSQIDHPAKLRGTESWMDAARVRWITRGPNSVHRAASRILLLLSVGGYVALRSTSVESLALPIVLLSACAAGALRHHLGFRLAERVLVYPDVLYFRVFDADRKATENHLSLLHTSYLTLVSAVGFVAFQPPPITEREHYGDEKSLTVTTGSYVLRTRDDGNWQDSVRALLRLASCAVIEGHAWSMSLRWEVEAAISILGPGKIIVVSDQAKVDEAERVLDQIRKLLASNGFFTDVPLLIRQKTWDGHFDRELEMRVMALTRSDDVARRQMFSVVHRHAVIKFVLLCACALCALWFAYQLYYR
ncbi:hypothetical protein [Sorangium sp. So ce854]|uniref:hypothetical protein n=1 Tax=Sorangium sp. So ce854 TaxID=3133322 RepID=UPI003F5EF62A